MDGTDDRQALLTFKEAANRLRVSPYTLKEWVRLRKIRAVKFTPKIIRLEAEAIDQFIRIHRVIKKEV